MISDPKLLNISSYTA